MIKASHQFPGAVTAVNGVVFEAVITGISACRII
jgi:hypothetical protein